MIDDRELDRVIYSPICARCNHFNFTNPEAHVCAAFPGGIPYEIWSGMNDHTQPYAGDHGIRFEKK